MWENIIIFVKDINVLLQFFALIIGALVLLKVYHYFSPSIRLKVVPKWLDDKRVILRLEIENISRVLIRKNTILLQILEYSVEKQTTLSEWVPFRHDIILPNEKPLKWNDPIEIFQSTEYIYPKEIIAIERLHCCTAKDHYFHIGLQFIAKSSFKLLKFRWLGHQEQWTTTTICRYVPDGV